VQSSPSYAQKPIRGVLDLRAHSFEQTPTIALEGEWQFFWNSLILPSQETRLTPELRIMPHLWNNDLTIGAKGFATYRLKILLPTDYPELALTIPDMYSSYTLYINKKVIAKNGVVASNPEQYTPYWLPKTVYLGDLDSPVVDLTLLIANFDHSKGGIRIPIILGESDILLAKREAELGFTYLLAGSLIMGALFFMGLFFFGQTEKAILYFALFCLVYSYRILGTELYPLHFLMPWLPWEVTIRLEYISLYFSAALFGLFVKQLYPNESNVKIMTAFNIVFLLFTVSVLVLPPFYFTALINYFFILSAVYITYVLYVLISAGINKQIGANYTLLSVFILFFIVGWDLLEYFTLIGENLFISYSAYILFFFLQSLTLSQRFAFRLNEAKEKAETASIAKTHFLSTMGHELRTPLNAVIGLSELLLDSKSDSEKTQFAKTIKKSGENLLGIINNILDFTKIESDEVQLNPKPTHIPSLLADTVKMLGSLTDANKVKLGFRFDHTLPDYIEVDAARLQQVLINLMGNAIKFTDRGDINIQVTSTASISEKDQILFIIKDTGIGIPEQKISLLFDRFSQIETDRNRRYGGTGLGLAISKRLIESMNGRIWVQSKEGEGTTFYFTIKAKAVPNEVITALKEEEEKQGNVLNTNLKILVVEDNLINQKVITKVLERLGFSSDIANDGFEAIQMVKKKTYDLIFMDMEMPEIDGIEATQRIRSLFAHARPPIIVAMTANATTEDKTRCFEAGMKDFIAKPITLKSTENVLLKWFS
jgi:signal transduction histidine kinase/CheY-like chemotaxis protein